MKSVLKTLTLASTIFLFSQLLSAQGKKLIINIPNRQTTSLNGTWQAIIDPFEAGYYNYRYQPLKQGFFSNRKPLSKSDRIEYDFDTAERLQVPGDWNSQDERLFFYEGTVWYKRDFDYSKASDRRLFVYFGAANYNAKVYLNGQKLGEHSGGFTPFNFEITDLVKPQHNFLIVKVDNTRHPAAVPALNTDWWNYGGITRDVHLVDVPESFIRDYFIQLERGSTKRVKGWIQLDGPRARQQITIRLPTANIETIVHTDRQGFAELEFEADLTLWSPLHPKLYDVEIASETDRITDRIGFRTIETKGGRILLNGKPLFLRGISVHEQAPLRGGRANSPEDARTVLQWVQELNANFVRLAHYPHNEHIVRLADETGILVWAEIPVYWTIEWDNPATLKNAKNQLSELITRDKNRAAVVLWSMSNETPLNESRLKFLSELATTARRLDATRLITSALELHYIDENTLMIDDPFGEHLDVIGINEYIGWYDGLPAKADRLSWRIAYEKPLIISELGAAALQGYHDDELTRWTEEYQANVYHHQIEMLQRIPFLKGVSPWILMDFRSPKRTLPGIQDYWNRKGLISDRGIKKEAFYILQDFYSDLAERFPDP